MAGPDNTVTTTRQQIQNYLENMKEPRSIADIDRSIGGSHPENLIDDINHVLKTLKMKGVTFKILPATCRKCNFVFKSTKMEVKIPTKCPKCKGELINSPILQRK
nr:transcriptional regulator [Candidatus Sigynarchaeota archaeon]